MVWFTVDSQPSSIYIAACVLSALVAVHAARRFVCDRTERKRHPLPPGPTPLPLVGSALSMNAQEPWLTYTAWREKYGDITYARLLDNDVIILNSHADAHALLEKRSQVYSDRPFIATIEPYGHGDNNISFARYGPYWRLSRRIIHQTFRAEAARAFQPMQLRRARQIIVNIADNPNEYQFHYSTYSAALAMTAVYDYEPKIQGDPIVKLVNDFLDASVPALTPEMAVLLKACPFLLRIPEWVPGLSRIRREARKATVLGNQVTDTPYQLVQNRIAAKEHIITDTMVFDHTQRVEKLDESHRTEYVKALKGASTTSILGSIETTAATLMTFTLGMVKNPRIWKRAQAEIDAVVGTDRLPEFEDRPSLPYVGAIVRECLRWYPVAPMGIPHAATTEDIYKGYYIPRGAHVFANLWGMSRDKTRYPDGDSFIPERFLNADGSLNEDDPTDFVFGFGRRRCPGRHVADASVWGAVATLLATLDFNAVKDENGNDVEFEAKFVTGIVHHPVTFPCNLVLRARVNKEALQRSLAK